ncbi:hypothetical protein [Cloacibacillus evryensis]|uniref:Uncharacterized protein n=5 Tax=root TaxID=1 RepID=A0AAW5K341_9BACT|nr:hypothetical protein [Cloacibacillus evryensis]EHL65256.1 hypothetical protein HMPREF1006_00269 [Synergistes sp. 3_1_syn1]MCQ4763518.1 hypothetical protein [Cloacibacillus evryensis]MCQ4814352.1 hypothetical protein [Cloacibacillus evryensis]MEA5033960.1 hypothetical protein [Cloacibacillus evryensis]
MKLTLKDPIRFTDKWVDTDGRESLSTFQGYSQFSEEDKKKAGAINNSMLLGLVCAALIVTTALYFLA